MTGLEIIAKVKELDWPAGEYIVFGSCPMALAGLREANDIDFLVSSKLFEKLKQAGWKRITKASDDKPVVKDDYEAHSSWDFSPNKPTLKHLLKTATVADGIPFASLHEVRIWKELSGRPKDLVDVKLIDEYLAKNA